MCEEWMNDSWAFIHYLEENLPPRQHGESINRIDNDGNYEPGNVEWADRVTQNRHRRAQIFKPHVGGKYLPWVSRSDNPHERYRGIFTYEGKTYYTKRYSTPEEAYQAVLAKRKEVGL